MRKGYNEYNTRLKVTRVTPKTRQQTYLNNSRLTGREAAWPSGQRHTNCLVSPTTPWTRVRSRARAEEQSKPFILMSGVSTKYTTVSVYKEIYLYRQVKSSYIFTYFQVFITSTYNGHLISHHASCMVTIK